MHFNGFATSTFQFCACLTLLRQRVMPPLHHRTSKSIITICFFQDFKYLIRSFTTSAICLMIYDCSSRSTLFGAIFCTGDGQHNTTQTTITFLLITSSTNFSPFVRSRSPLSNDVLFYMIQCSQMHNTQCSQSLSSRLRMKV